MITPQDARHFADSIVAAVISTGADNHIDDNAKDLWTAGTLLRHRDETFRTGLTLGIEALLNSPDAMCEMLQQIRDTLGPEAVRELE